MCVWSLCVQLCRCLCCFLFLCLSALAIGSRLRLKHLKLGACHEMQTLHFDCQPETINQSHFPLLSLPSLSLPTSLSSSCFASALLLFLCVMHFARKLEIISILLCENNGYANDVHLYGFSCCACACVCEYECLRVLITVHVANAFCCTVAL